MTDTHQLTCAQCSASFESGKAWAKYCSAKCRVAAARGRQAEAGEPVQCDTPDVTPAHRAAERNLPEPSPWTHGDRQRALALLTVHLGYASEARTALAIIEGLADPASVTSLEQWVRGHAAIKAIRPLLAKSSMDAAGAGLSLENGPGG